MSTLTGMAMDWFISLPNGHITTFQQLSRLFSYGDQAQENMEATHQAQEEVEAQMEDAHGDQSPPQRITRSMFKALGARGHLFSLFVVSLVEGA